jgi:lipid A 3-O-deacylase
MRKLLKTLLNGLVMLSLPTVAAGNRWIDSMSATVGDDKNSNQMDIYRIGVQNRWNRTWFNDGAWYLGGYWDVSMGYMESGYDDSDLYEFSLTPVLRLQRDAEISSGFAPFSELGVGGHLLTDDEIGKRELGTGFQLASHIGLGLGFGDKGRYELAYRFQHLGNAGIKSPNNGLDLHLLSFGYHFD